MNLEWDMSCKLTGFGLWSGAKLTPWELIEVNRLYLTGYQIESESWGALEANCDKWEDDVADYLWMQYPDVFPETLAVRFRQHNPDSWEKIMWDIFVEALDD